MYMYIYIYTYIYIYLGIPFAIIPFSLPHQSPPIFLFLPWVFKPQLIINLWGGFG